MAKVEKVQNIISSQLTLEEKLKIKNKGRMTPDLKITLTGTSKNKNYVRKFNTDWYQKYKWLTGCEITNALFCFPCLLFGGDKVWTKTGFQNIRNMKEKCEKHQRSRKHINNVVSLSLLGKVNFSEQLSGAYKQSNFRHNERVKKNREVLSKIIDCIKFCGHFELQLGGDDESTPDSGIFKGLINFIATFDLPLREHLESNSLFNWTSKTIQNELLQCILEVCQDHIISEINTTSFVAVMIDDTTDVSEQVQTAIVFRYELNGSVYERFWGFLTPDNITSEGLSNCIMKELNKVLKNDTNKLISQSYDCANIIKEEEGGVQQKIQTIYKNAHYIHSYTHQSNLIMKHSTLSVKSVRLFFSNLSGIPSYFSESPEKLAILEKHIKGHTSRPSSSVNFHSRTVNAVYENKQALIECFKELQSSINTTDKEIQQTTGFICLLNDESFIFWLELFHLIMPHVELLFSQMQERNIDAYKSKTLLDNFQKAILLIGNSKKYKLEKNSEVKEVCERILVQMEDRFKFQKHLIAAKLFFKENFDRFFTEFPNQEIRDACDIYPGLINQEKLQTELEVFYSRTEFHNFNGLLPFLNIIKDENLSTAFSEMIKIIRILVTIPMRTSEGERCFSTLQRVKSCLRNTMGQDKLSALCMISVEKKIISEIPNFNEKVINKFCHGENEKMDFIY